MKEPKKWEKLEAFKLLERDIRKGAVPLEAPEGGDWEAVYLMHPEYVDFDHSLFQERLGNLRKAASKHLSRAEEDEEAFNAYLGLHPIAIFSHKGYEQ
jgi:hypothetical protein